MKFENNPRQDAQQSGGFRRPSGTGTQTTDRSYGGGPAFRTSSEQNTTQMTPQNQRRFMTPQYSNRYQPMQPRRASVFQRLRDSIEMNTFPWRPVIIVAIVITAIVLAVVFRREITEFLRMVLSWVLTIGVIALILWLIFRRRRRY